MNFGLSIGFVIKNKGREAFLLSRPLCKENIKRFVVFYAVAEDMLRAIFSPISTDIFIAATALQRLYSA